MNIISLIFFPDFLAWKEEVKKDLYTTLHLLGNFIFEVVCFCTEYNYMFLNDGPVSSLAKVVM